MGWIELNALNFSIWWNGSNWININLNFLEIDFIFQVQKSKLNNLKIEKIEKSK